MTGSDFATIRKSLGFTQKAIADRMGYSRQHIGLMETKSADKTLPDHVAAHLLCIQETERREK